MSDLNTMTPTEFLNAINSAREVLVSVDLGGWAQWMKTTKNEARNLFQTIARNDTSIPATLAGDTLFIG